MSGKKDSTVVLKFHQYKPVSRVISDYGLDELCELRTNTFLKRYTSPPIKALKRIINKIIIEKIKAISSGIPIRINKNIRAFSLNPIPP
ncbi:MAG: hypothetical protein RBR58_03830, partial [Candidatus Humimicrobiaceae bacterium]|nr:hypothetical protein [Candidatus Humimicrobiaceae bacterium]